MKGGIDFTPSKMNVRTEIASSPLASRNDPAQGVGIQFKINPAMLAEAEHASGFVPLIVSIRPMNNLRQFLGC